MAAPAASDGLFASGFLDYCADLSDFSSLLEEFDNLAQNPTTPVLETTSNVQGCGTPPILTPQPYVQASESAHTLQGHAQACESAPVSTTTQYFQPSDDAPAADAGPPETIMAGSPCDLTREATQSLDDLFGLSPPVLPSLDALSSSVCSASPTADILFAPAEAPVVPAGTNPSSTATAVTACAPTFGLVPARATASTGVSFSGSLTSSNDGSPQEPAGRPTKRRKARAESSTLIVSSESDDDAAPQIRKRVRGSATSKIARPVDSGGMTYEVNDKPPPAIPRVPVVPSIFAGHQGPISLPACLPPPHAHPEAVRSSISSSSGPQAVSTAAQSGPLNEVSPHPRHAEISKQLGIPLLPRGFYGEDVHVLDAYRAYVRSQGLSPNQRLNHMPPVARATASLPHTTPAPSVISSRLTAFPAHLVAPAYSAGPTYRPPPSYDAPQFSLPLYRSPTHESDVTDPRTFYAAADTDAIAGSSQTLAGRKRKAPPAPAFEPTARTPRPLPPPTGIPASIQRRVSSTPEPGPRTPQTRANRMRSHRDSRSGGMARQPSLAAAVVPSQVDGSATPNVSPPASASPVIDLARSPESTATVIQVCPRSEKGERPWKEGAYVAYQIDTTMLALEFPEGSGDRQRIEMIQAQMTKHIGLTPNPSALDHVADEGVALDLRYFSSRDLPLQRLNKYHLEVHEYMFEHDDRNREIMERLRIDAQHRGAGELVEHTREVPGWFAPLQGGKQWVAFGTKVTVTQVDDSGMSFFVKDTRVDVLNRRHIVDKREIPDIFEDLTPQEKHNFRVLQGLPALIPAKVWRDVSVSSASLSDPTRFIREASFLRSWLLHLKDPEMHVRPADVLT